MNVLSDRAEEVIRLGDQEAHRLNHKSFGTEHLLFGLLKEGQNIGCQVLKNLNLLEIAKSQVEQSLRIAPRAYDGSFRTTNRLRHVLDVAAVESQSLGHGYVGTEHLLLALIKEKESVVGVLFEDMGLDIDKVYLEIRNLLGETNAANHG